MYGVVECSRELFKQDNLKASDFLIDIGAASKKDAEAYVSLGDTVVLDAGVGNLQMADLQRGHSMIELVFL